MAKKAKRSPRTRSTPDKPAVSPLAAIISRRHSSRGPFDLKRPVPRAALLRILDAARWAPTAHNMQNFEIVVVDDPALLETLGCVRSGLNSDFIRENYRQLSFSEAELLRKKRGILARMFPASWSSPEAKDGQVPSDEPRSHLWDVLHGGPTLLVVLYDTRERAPASQNDALGFISLGCVMENIWLTAESLGLGCHIISALSSNLVGEKVEEEAREILGFPPHFRIAFACRLGYPLDSGDRSLRVRRDLADFCHVNRFGTMLAPQKPE